MNRYRWTLWAPLSGLASAAFFVLAFALSAEVGGENREVSEFYADSGNRAQVQTAFFFFAAAFLLLVWFVWTLRNRLMAAEGAPGNLATLAFAAGMISVPLWFVASAAFAAPAFDYAAGEFDVQATQLLGWAGYGAFVGAQMVFAFTVFVVAGAHVSNPHLPRLVRVGELDHWPDPPLRHRLHPLLLLPGMACRRERAHVLAVMGRAKPDGQA